MKWTKGLKTAVGFSATCFGILFAGGPAGATGFAASPLPFHAPIYKDEFKDVIRFVRVTVLGGKPGAHVWEIVGDTGIAYSSLYAPELRKRLSSQPKGTRIAEEVSPAAEVVIIHGQLSSPDPDQREWKDFGNFCLAHDLHIIALPVS